MALGKFWMVQGMGKRTRAARFRHPTVESAQKEAKRLSSENPGKPYFVMECIGCEYVPGPPPPAQKKKMVDAKPAVS